MKIYFKKKFLSILSLSLFLLSFSLTALADEKCGISLFLSPLNVVFQYGRENSHTHTITVRRSKVKDSCQDFLISFGRGHSSDYNRYLLFQQHKLYYQIMDKKNGQILLKAIEDISDANSREVLKGKFEGESTEVQMEIFMDIPLDPSSLPQLLPKGTYQDLLEVKIFIDDNKPGKNPEATTFWNLQAVIPTLLEMSVSSPSVHMDPQNFIHHLNFGNLTTGQSMQFDLRIRTNTGYQIYLSSQNDGQLKINTGENHSTIPYTLKINQSIISLMGTQSSPKRIGSSAANSPWSGILFQGEVIIGQTDDKDAGAYHDQIIITTASFD